MSTNSYAKALQEKVNKDAVLFADRMLKMGARTEKAGIDYDSWYETNTRNFYTPQDYLGYWVIRRQFKYCAHGTRTPLKAHCNFYGYTRDMGFAQARHLGMSSAMIIDSGLRAMQPEKTDIVITAAGRIIERVKHNCFSQNLELKIGPRDASVLSFVEADSLRSSVTADIVYEQWKNDLQTAEEAYGKTVAV